MTYQTLSLSMPIMKQSIRPRLEITIETSRVHAAANESRHDKTPILRNIIDGTHRNGTPWFFFRKKKTESLRTKFTPAAALRFKIRTCNPLGRSKFPFGMQFKFRTLELVHYSTLSYVTG